MIDLEDRRLPTKLAWRIWRRGNLGVLAGAAIVVVIAVLSAPVYLTGVPVGRLIPYFLVVPPLFLANGSLVGRLVTSVYASRAFAWAGSGREPTAREIRRMAAVPRNAATVVIVLWAAHFPPLVLVFTRWLDVAWPRGIQLLSGIIIAFSGLTAAVITYLLAEQVARPLLAAVLPADTQAWPRTLGMTRRLLLGWLMASAIPIGIVAFNFASLDATQRAVAGPSLVIGCALIVVVGSVVFGVIGTSITGPVEAIRRGMGNVQEGDLEASVPATDAGELGLLQVGFNQMVDGLRERERMRDLFGRHVGVEVARRAMTGEGELGGEERTVTTMFVDIIASTHLAQTRSPNEVVAILNDFFEAVVRAVGDEHGLINKFAGDGAMCVFGAPGDQPDHALRALRSARRLKEKLDGLDAIDAAIGVSTGEVVAGNVGSLDRYEYTVIGDPVNEAARLTEQAKLISSRVLASERTVLAAGDECANWTMGHTLELRGRAEPTVTYEPKA
jgi:adenylate cyclase